MGMTWMYCGQLGFQRIIHACMVGGLLVFAFSAFSQGTNSSWRSTELRRFKAPEAAQGVAVDDEFFYAIANREIGKYRKDDGTRVAGWKGREEGPFVHLNAGVVRDGRLYAAHSNYPHVPMVSSIEMWDVQTLTHVGSQKLGETDGSLTWLDYRKGRWHAGFAHYAKGGGIPGRGPEHTKVVQYEQHWKVAAEWTFPKELVKLFTPNSCSCAGYGPDGFLYATGHDAKELYVLEMPQSGSVLRWVGTVPVKFEGQGFAWDPANPDILYGISRGKREVVVVRVVRGVRDKEAAGS